MKHAQPSSSSSLRKNILPIAAVIAFACLTSACGVKGSGVIVQERLYFDGYDSIVLADGLRGTALIGDDYSVLLSADDNLIDMIRVEEVDGEVRVDFNNGSYRNGTIDVEFTLPYIKALSLEDGSRLSADRIEVGASLKLRVSDGSDLSLSLALGEELEHLSVSVEDGSAFEVDAISDETLVDLSDGSRGTLEGEGTTMSISIEDGSSLGAKDYAVEELSFSLRDGSSAKVRVSEQADGVVREGSNLSVWGGAHVDADVSEGSSINEN